MISEQKIFSVIIPTHNRKDQLKEALSRYAVQTFPPEKFEVVVVDGGSTDGTFASNTAATIRITAEMTETAVTQTAVVT